MLLGFVPAFSKNYYFVTFLQVELSHFSGVDSWYLVCSTFADCFEVFGHGLKMCIWFGYYTQIVFVTFFRS